MRITIIFNDSDDRSVLPRTFHFNAGTPTTIFRNDNGHVTVLEVPPEGFIDTKDHPYEKEASETLVRDFLNLYGITYASFQSVGRDHPVTFQMQYNGDLLVIEGDRREIHPLTLSPNPDYNPSIEKSIRVGRSTQKFFNADESTMNKRNNSYCRCCVIM